MSMRQQVSDNWLQIQWFVLIRIFNRIKFNFRQNNYL